MMDTVAMLQYPGSKARLARQIIDLFPPHRLYVEPFGGSAAVLLTKEPSASEIYSDANDDIVTLFRVARDRTDELRDLLELTPYARSERTAAYRALKSRKQIDDLEHARLVFTLYNQSFSGSVVGRAIGWSVGTKDNSAAGFRSRIQNLNAIAERLANVQIENLRFDEIFRRYDAEDAVFYIDPPYLPETREVDLYEYEMYPHEHLEMVRLLLTAKSRCILSGYDTPIYKPLVEAGWTRIDIDVMETMSGATAKGKRVETIWHNIETAPPQERETVVVQEPATIDTPAGQGNLW